MPLNLSKEELTANNLISLPVNEFGCTHLYIGDSIKIPVIVNKPTSHKKTDRYDYNYHVLCDWVGRGKIIIFNDPSRDHLLAALSDDFVFEKRRIYKTFDVLKEEITMKMLSPSDIASKLIVLWDAYYKTFDDTSEIDEMITGLHEMTNPAGIRHYHKLTHGHCQNIEASTNRDIKNIINGEAIYWATPAATCSADAGYRLKASRACMCLGLQLKVSTQNLRSGNYQFSHCNGYPGMLIICRPIPANKASNTFLVMPNAITPTRINQSFLKTTNPLNKMIVHKDQLTTLLHGLYEAIVTKQQTYVWPSGFEIDISDLKFFTETELNMPTSKHCKKEYENLQKRESIFPDSTYIYPDYQAHYDVVMDGVRIQDKCAEQALSKYYRVKIVKNAGNVDGKRTKGPYEVNDFDLLYVNLPDTRNIFIIPAFELNKRGILKTKAHPGVSWVSCHTPGWTSIRKLKNPIWTDKYYVDFSESTACDKVKAILDDVRSRPIKTE